MSVRGINLSLKTALLFDLFPCLRIVKSWMHLKLLFGATSVAPEQIASHVFQWNRFSSLSSYLKRGSNRKEASAADVMIRFDQTEY